MQFIDTHIHLQDFKADFALQVLEEPAVQRVVLISAKMADFAQIATLAEKMPEKCVPAFGVHPWYWRDGADVELLQMYLKKFPKALVGEIGVDGIKESPNVVQHQLFNQQLAVAEEYARSVVVHAARAVMAFFEHEQGLKKVRFVHHGFVKNRELIKFINKCDGYFGLGAHFLKQEKAAEMFADMPKNRVLFETDAPYQVSEMGYAEIVQSNLQKLSAICGMPERELEGVLLQNAKDFLRC
ncbi:MAG: TatD family hydrolase [Acetobacter sp.]|nr:TatD family hydrolase [Acetobacter sp.]